MPDSLNISGPAPSIGFRLSSARAMAFEGKTMMSKSLCQVGPPPPLESRLANRYSQRRVMMQRNSVHNLPKELAQTVQLLGALTRQIRKRAGHAQQVENH